jgi:hypothetical protein
MVDVTIENRSNYTVNLTVTGHAAVVMPHGTGTTLDVNPPAGGGSPTFHAAVVGPPPPPIWPANSIVWPYDPPRKIAIAIKIDDAHFQLSFYPGGSIQS